jgi:FSR family fosmidomycin resistance protein-like MFS transporter
VIIAALVARSIGAAPVRPQPAQAASFSGAGRDNWRAFGILSGATVCRSIVFYGLNTFLALYFMNRFGQDAARGNLALIVFLGTSIFGTLLGGWLADRFGRRAVIRSGYAGAVVLLALFMSVARQELALALLVPLAVFIFMPTSVLVVLGQEYLPRRVGMASGVTLGLAVSVGGMCAPLLGQVADRHGLDSVLVLLWALLTVAAAQTWALPPAGHRDERERKPEALAVAADSLE